MTSKAMDDMNELMAKHNDPNYDILADMIKTAEDEECLECGYTGTHGAGCVKTE